MTKLNNNNTKLSPERYIREKARLLPIYECYKFYEQEDSCELSIIVVRKHLGETYTFAAYLLDRWCLGVIKSSWQFSISESELYEYLSLFKDDGLECQKIDYVEAHNWVYGALDWATNAGISPCPEFQLTKYILEEDDDNIELREYEFGLNGEYCLKASNHKEIDRYLPILDKNLGHGMYKVILRPELSEDIDSKALFDYFIHFPLMKYTYKGTYAPKGFHLHHNGIMSMLCKDLYEYTSEDIDAVLAFPADTLREDLQHLILHSIAYQRDQISKHSESDEFLLSCRILDNSFVFLSQICTVKDTLSVITEYYRQNGNLLNVNAAVLSEYVTKPIIRKLMLEEPTCFKSYLLEKGLFTYAKMEVFSCIRDVACCNPSIREPLLNMMREILEAYRIDLPYRTMCDGHVVASAIRVLVELRATDFLPLIEDIYYTGLVDENICGIFEKVREKINSPFEPKTKKVNDNDIYALVKSYQDYIIGLSKIQKV